MKRRLIALIFVLGVAAWLASVAAACHSEITGSLNCSGTVSYTASAWNASGATTAQRTNSDVRVWASTDSGQSYVQIGRGSFSQSNNFQFSGTWNAGSAAAVVLKVQEVANWASGQAPEAPRYVTVARPNCSSSGGGSQCTSASMVSSAGSIAVSGGSASESFSVAQGCSVSLTLVSYSGGHVYQSHTDTVGPGSYTWQVSVPSCSYTVNFGYTNGSVIKTTSGSMSTCSSGSGGSSNNQPPAAPPAPVPAPSVSLTKLERVGAAGNFVAGPVTAAVGKTVAYELVVTNTGTTTISVNLKDDGCDAGTLSPAGPQAILAGASLTFTCSHKLAAADGAQYVNTALVTANNAGSQEATAIASATTKIGVSGVAGATKTITKKHKTVKVTKVKKVVRRAKPARPVLRTADFTG